MSFTAVRQMRWHRLRRLKMPDEGGKRPVTRWRAACRRRPWRASSAAPGPSTALRILGAGVRLPVEPSLS
jgi:hypothetical protein